MGFSPHIHCPLNVSPWRYGNVPQTNSSFSFSFSKLIHVQIQTHFLSELKNKILSCCPLFQNGKNIHPITLAGNKEINAAYFLLSVSSYLAYSFFLSHLFILTMTLPPPNAHCSAIIINPPQNHPMLTFKSSPL